MSRRRADEETRTLPAAHKPDAPAQGVKITVTEGLDKGRSAVVSQRTVLIGRSPVADLRLTDPRVSAFHVEVSAAAGGLQVTDLKSRNGTGYAGARVRDAVVPSGAALELGTTRLLVELDAPFVPEASETFAFGELRGRSVGMREVFSLLSRLARTDLSILIEGATGTGKELAARAVHAGSRHAAGPFLVLDCTAIPGTLAESVLFGHEKGAFTGATERRAGIFESAEGGTVFLDEVGELPVELQPKLLRVLERREVVRVGATEAVPVKVRVLCATWRDLRAMINAERFREDLYYRLAQARVAIPALADRPDDVGLLVLHFLQGLPRHLQAARAIAPEALNELTRRVYRGNVRELKSTVERAACLAEGAMITTADLAFERMLAGERGHAPQLETAPPAAGPVAPGASEGHSAGDAAAAGTDGAGIVPFKTAKRTLVEDFERAYLQRLMARAGGNVTRAAALAGIERHYLRDLVRKHGLGGED